MNNNKSFHFMGLLASPVKIDSLESEYNGNITPLSTLCTKRNKVRRRRGIEMKQATNICCAIRFMTKEF